MICRQVFKLSFCFWVSESKKEMRVYQKGMQTSTLLLVSKIRQCRWLLSEVLLMIKYWEVSIINKQKKMRKLSSNRSPTLFVSASLSQRSRDATLPNLLGNLLQQELVQLKSKKACKKDAFLLNRLKGDKKQQHRERQAFNRSISTQLVESRIEDIQNIPVNCIDLPQKPQKKRSDQFKIRSLNKRSSLLKVSMRRNQSMIMESLSNNQSLVKSNCSESSNASLAQSDDMSENKSPKSFKKRLTKKYSLSHLNTSGIQEINEHKSNFFPRVDLKFQQNLKKYQDFLLQAAKVHKLPINFIEKYAKNTFFYRVDKGNNPLIVRQMMKKRWWWTDYDSTKITYSQDLINFEWTQLKKTEYFVASSTVSIEQNNIADLYISDNQSQKTSEQGQFLYQMKKRRVHNHFEKNWMLGNRIALLASLKQFYRSTERNFHKHMLQSFHVKRFRDLQWKEFTETYFKDFGVEALDKYDVTKNQRLWIIKAAQNKNRRIRSQIFKNYRDLKDYILREASEVVSFIIQRYIDRPFLFKNRKFGVFCYLMISRLNGTVKGYLYKDGYLETSSQAYDSADLKNQFAHLTSQNIQLNHEKFGQFEPGNKMNFLSFQNYLDLAYKDKYNFYTQVYPKMKEIATHMTEANYKRIGDWKNHQTFQLYQLEFMIDSNFVPWLIDVHTNPCLETTCLTLQKIIPKMIDETFQLTIDILFPPPLVWPKSKKGSLPPKINDNDFQLVFDELKTFKLLEVEPFILPSGIDEDVHIYEDELEDESVHQSQQEDDPIICKRREGGLMNNWMFLQQTS